MSDIRLWSPIDDNNNADPPDGFREGQPAKSLNDASRAVMGGVRREWEDKEWFEHGHSISFSSADTAVVAGDQSSIYTLNRRVRCSGTNTGLVYGRVTGVVVSTDTTLTITLDSGSLVPEIDQTERISVGAHVTGQPVAGESVEGLDRVVPQGVPPGTVTHYAAAAAPSGWLLCDGASYPVASYPALHAVIGDVFGGDGGTNFNVPNVASRTIVTQGTGAGLTTRTIADTGGEESVTLTEQQIPAHSHGPPAGFSNFIMRGGTGLDISPGATSQDQPLTGETGGGQSHENMPPFLVLNTIIRT